MMKRIFSNIYRLLAGMLLVFLLNQAYAADGISFSEFSIHNGEHPGELLTSLKLDQQLSDYLREGLLNGMSLEGEIQFNLEWHNAWWWNTDKRLASLKTELKYHALSQHYQLVRLDTNENWNFPTLTSALDKMGTLVDYPLPPLPANAYKNDASIFVTASLRPKSLQLPLKVQSLFSDRYSLTSEGVVWPIP